MHAPVSPRGRLEQYLGLVVAAMAMIVYNLKPELYANGRSVEGAHAFESRPTTIQSFSSDRAGYTARVSHSRVRVTVEGPTVHRDVAFRKTVS